MSIAEIKQLPLKEKLQIMEAFWDDLRSNIETIDIPEWHQKVLEERRQAVAQGREKIHDWDDVKTSLGSKSQ